jgi:hypothetical protein
MAREDTQLPKKREKTGGRAKGTPNKATTVAGRSPFESGPPTEQYLGKTTKYGVTVRGPRPG